MSEGTVCSFCERRAERAVSGRRTGAPARVVCALCVEGLEATHAGPACDFCDHPAATCARSKTGIAACADCVAFARQVLGDDEGAPAGDEARIDPEQLWSDLTPAPRPDVDPDAPATAHADLALAFFEMGLYDDAREQLGKALSLDPRHAVALHLLEKLPPPGGRS